MDTGGYSPVEATRMELMVEHKDPSGRFEYLIIEMINAYPTTTGTEEVYQPGRSNHVNLNLL